MGKKKGAAPAAPTDAQAAPEFEMVFHAQLAHGSPTRQVKDFTNVKQLYESIAKAFGIQSSEILYCTLNTHKVDMTRLLGGQIGLDDFLFAHVMGDTNKTRVSKDGPALGLTISDNGAGYAFIKKIREDSIMAQVRGCKVGDHISSINGTNLKGCRHFEVARLLKEIPIGSEFDMELVSPKLAADASLAPRAAQGGSGNVSSGSGKKTLRMKKDGTTVVEEVNDALTQLVNKVDDMLENFVGIRDSELSTVIAELAKESTEADVFAGALDEKLSDFEFPDDFVLDVFEMVHQ